MNWGRICWSRLLRCVGTGEENRIDAEAPSLSQNPQIVLVESQFTIDFAQIYANSVSSCLVKCKLAKAARCSPQSTMSGRLL
jgi:hypothetical protein